MDLRHSEVPMKALKHYAAVALCLPLIVTVVAIAVTINLLSEFDR